MLTTRSKPTMRVVALCVALASLAPPAQAGTAPPTLSELLRQAVAQDLTPEAHTYHADSLIRERFFQAFEACRTPRDTLYRFQADLVLVLNAEGRVIRVLHSRGPRTFHCAANRLATETWPPPPHSGWLLHLRVQWRIAE